MNNNSIKRFLELRKALLVEKHQIEARLTVLNEALGAGDAGGLTSIQPSRVRAGGKRKRVLSAAWRAKIAAAQRRRWAARNNAAPAGKTKSGPPKKPTIREMILKLVAAKRLTRDEIIKGLKATGFKSKSANLGNTLSQYLYGKSAVVKNVGGKFGPK